MNEYGQADAPAGRFTAVSAGKSHSCGLRVDGVVECWGSSDEGQTISLAGEFTAVSAGVDHSCGLRADGTVKCWKAFPSPFIPIPDYVQWVDANTRWVDVREGGSDGPVEPLTAGVNSEIGQARRLSAGHLHVCALDADGSIECWGGNEFGQSDAPMGTFTAVSAGGTFSCGLRTDGTATCPGTWRELDGVFADEIFSTFSAGYNYVCGLRTDGTVTCPGTPWREPDGVFTTVSVGYEHACGLRIDGAIICWGGNDSGQSDAAGGSFTAVSAGFEESCGVRVDGTIICWGDPPAVRDRFQTRRTSRFIDPRLAIRRVDRPAFVAVSLAEFYTCGLRDDGSVDCWGESFGGLRKTPTGPFTEIATASDFACGLRGDGTVICWGDKNIEPVMAQPPSFVQWVD